MTKRKIALLLIFTIAFGSLIPAKAFFSWFSKSKKTSSRSMKIEKKETGDIRFAFVSDTYLYPVPTSQEGFSRAPKSKEGIMYAETQVLLQELVSDIVKNQKDNQLDFVLFGGSQVANNYHWNLFLDIMDELTKHQIDYYFLIGDGEHIGELDLDDISKEKYWHKKFYGFNLLALDNSNDLISLQQTGWLTRKIKELEADHNDVLVFSYRPLSAPMKSVLQALPNLKLIANSYDLKFKLEEPNPGNPYSKPYTTLSNSSLAVYPCAYSIITHKRDGKIKVSQQMTSLKGVQKAARKELESL